jgi:hypothetical protein
MRVFKMQSLKQLVSFVLIFQLCYACNGGGGATAVSSGVTENLVNIKGTFAKVFHSFGNLLINSAVANDGTINVFDITDPASPQPLGTFEVDDESQGFSFQIESSKIKGKVISIKYEGGDKSSFGSRSMVLEVEDEPSEIEVEEMNSESSVQSEIILTRLKNESVSKEDLKIRFKKLHEQKLKILDDIKELGLSVDVLHEYLKDEKKIKLIETIAEAWAAGVDEDDDIRKSAFDTFKEVANDEAPELVKNARLYCEGNYSKFFSPNEGSFKLLVSGKTEGIQYLFDSKEKEFGVGNSNEINKLMSELLARFNQVSEQFKEAQILSITVIGDNDFNDTCKISSKKVENDIVACQGLDCPKESSELSKNVDAEPVKIQMDTI